MKLLNYHNIVQFKEVFIDKENQFNIVKEHTGGGRLSQIILKRGRAVPEKHWLSEDQILNYFTQICLTIKHCHDRNIRYCDLKSGYIKVTQSGRCKLDDFALAEIINTKDPTDPKPLLKLKTDIWDLGVILFEMTTLELHY